MSTYTGKDDEYGQYTEKRAERKVEATFFERLIGVILEKFVRCRLHITTSVQIGMDFPGWSCFPVNEMLTDLTLLPLVGERGCYFMLTPYFDEAHLTKQSRELATWVAFGIELSRNEPD